ncbi:twin-arginine translocase subunit TatC [Jatrophihabitans telluris]|uniref:Sec-independent protein translocase protein TatC n=1 Tax=Jatrophihabitans telluris TaxID=2038343 RepID=A0ABY4QUA3_9ACTN|nr:twin-arginine translocase subunit TatC [Jatrophihabitans telluris]UQX86661.1 twin-arginine translocase subunit TatC [Jatrophihabitans telluris]
MVKFRKRPAGDPEGRMSVLDHLRELRRRVAIVLVILFLGAIIGWLFYNPILHLLEKPYCNVPFQRRLGATKQSDCDLLYSAPLDGFTIRLKISMITGSIITAPLWLFQIWAFVTPGLRRSERKYSLIFAASSSVLFVAGMAMAYWTLSRGLNALIELSGSGTKAALGVQQYISFVTLVLLTFGASFELPLLIVMLNITRVLPYSLLKRGQRLGIFLVFVFTAVATPSTDPFTMTLMAVPLLLLFEAAVLVAFLHDRRRARRQIADEEQRAAEQLPDDVASVIDPRPSDLPTRAASLESEWTELP